jgi:hypothetical protein
MGLEGLSGSGPSQGLMGQVAPSVVLVGGRVRSPADGSAPRCFIFDDLAARVARPDRLPARRLGVRVAADTPSAAPGLHRHYVDSARRRANPLSAKSAFGQPSADNWIHDRPTSRVAPTGMLAGRSRLLLSPNGESRQAARANADVRIRRC